VSTELSETAAREAIMGQLVAIHAKCDVTMPDYRLEGIVDIAFAAGRNYGLKVGAKMAFDEVEKQLKSQFGVTP
jgi:hypothetical protein